MKNIQMDLSMKEKRVKDKEMGLENIIIKMVGIMKATGKKIKLMVWEFYIFKMEELHMMDSGKTINLMDMAFYIINNPRS